MGGIKLAADTVPSVVDLKDDKFNFLYLFDTLKTRADIVGYIGMSVNLKKNGKNYIGLCPFHGEKTPSFFVAPQKKLYKCFGCGVGGNVLFGCGQKSAAYAGITIRETSQKETPVRTEEDRLFEDVMDFFCEHLKKCRADSSLAKLIAKRKLAAYSIDKYALGYAPDSTAITGGCNDFYRNRLIFPIRDIAGRVIGFGGRAIGDEMPKYINPPETPLYSKSKVLYGLYEANSAVRKKSRMIVTEGYIDVIRMAQEGFDDTVALCGTAMTDAHLRIILLPDGDSAGQASAAKSSRLLLSAELPGYVCRLEQGVDPGDFFDRFPADKMEALLKQSSDAAYYIVSNAARTAGQQDSNTRLRTLEELMSFSSTLSPERHDHLNNLTAELFAVRRDILDTLNTGSPAVKPAQTETTDVPSAIGIRFQNLKQLYPRDFNIIECLLTGYVPTGALYDVYPPEMFQDTYLRGFYKTLLGIPHADLASLSYDQLREAFPEFNELMDFLDFFEDGDLKREQPQHVRRITCEHLTRNLYEYYRTKAKSQPTADQADILAHGRRQIQTLTEIFTVPASLAAG
ncbi:hypothetical protein CHS0354_030068 [Potamilus streckersoni]|uniref:Toprim domain-containing protein n=1 Tax=Potamilus streckersoni TaxID=2493646 RepID=A0AAE0RLQ3_9BIVA|nr:hypothetical protein CHS0354_030068 [Potamilus streckersoni]